MAGKQVAGFAEFQDAQKRVDGSPGGAANSPELGMWLSLVERPAGGRKVAGSIPAIPTIDLRAG